MANNERSEAEVVVWKVVVLAAAAAAAAYSLFVLMVAQTLSDKAAGWFLIVKNTIYSNGDYFSTCLLRISL